MSSTSTTQEQQQQQQQQIFPQNNNNIYYQSDYHMKFVGTDINENPIIKEFFSKKYVDHISRECTKLLKGVDELGRDIVIPDKRILEVMNVVEQSFNFATGFDAPQYSPYGYIRKMVEECIERIVYDVSNTLAIEQCNNKKTIWTTVLGDFNKEKLQSHSSIKIRQKHPNLFQINMRY